MFFTGCAHFSHVCKLITEDAKKDIKAMDGNSNISFGYFDAYVKFYTNPTEKFKIKQAVWFNTGNNEDDVGLLVLDQTSLEHPGLDYELQVSANEPSHNVTIIGYSLEKKTTKFGLAECEFSSLNFSHNCETEEGCSGSPVLHQITGKVVAVHNKSPNIN